MVQLNSEVVKLHRERKVQSTESFCFLNPTEFIRILEKCWKIAFHLKVDRKLGSLVVSALAFSARGHGFDPRSRREMKSVTEHAFLSAMCRDDIR